MGLSLPGDIPITHDCSQAETGRISVNSWFYFRQLAYGNPILLRLTVAGSSLAPVRGKNGRQLKFPYSDVKYSAWRH